MLVSGEAGIGKSALLGRFCDGLGTLPRSARTLWAACDPLFTPRPLGPLLDIARFTDGQLQGQLDAAPSPMMSPSRCWPSSSSPLRPCWCSRTLHWADEATLDVLRLLARRVETTPVLLVISYRDDQLSAAHPLRMRARASLPERGVARLRLDRLSADAVAELAAAIAVDADELYRTTVGQPVLRHRGARGRHRRRARHRSRRGAGPGRATRAARHASSRCRRGRAPESRVWLLEALIDAPAGRARGMPRLGDAARRGDGRLVPSRARPAGGRGVAAAGPGRALHRAHSPHCRPAERRTRSRAARPSRRGGRRHARGAPLRAGGRRTGCLRRGPPRG